MLGISTCWWDNKSLRGDEIVNGVLELGLKRVELEYRLTHRIYEQMIPRLKDTLTVLSVHNFFPNPEHHPAQRGSGDLFLLSSTDEDERSMAVDYTIQTMEYAQDLGALAVVLHLGHVDMPNATADFIQSYRRGKVGQKEGLAVLNQHRHTRKARQKRNLDRVLFSLDKLNRVAEEKGLFLGIENRFHFHEIPNFEEIGVILKQFRGGKVRYWHDVGHAGVQENLGICRQEDLLEAYSEAMIGIHLHDVKGLEDHLPPGQGEIDYEALSIFMKSSPIKILEINRKAQRQELLRSIHFIKSRDLG
jgi:sugar phosphate isomerase/epimerase